MEEWVKSAWESAQQMGLTSRWEFWVAVVAALVLLVVAKRLGPPLWLYWRSLPPPPDLVEHPPSPPIPVQPDGTIPLRQEPPKEYL